MLGRFRCDLAVKLCLFSAHEGFCARPKVDSPTEVRHTLFRLHHGASEQATDVYSNRKIYEIIIFNFRLLSTHHGEFLDCMTFVLE